MSDVVTFGVELRLADDQDGRTVEGVAVPYNEVTDLTSHGQERFAPGSMKRTVDRWSGSRRQMPLLRGHDQDKPIGKVVTFNDTPEGLMVVARLADTALGREAAQEVREGVLDAFSIGFRAVRAERVAGVREVREAAIHELSLVPLPAYSGAEVLAVRSQGLSPAEIVIPDMPNIAAIAGMRIGGV